MDATTGKRTGEEYGLGAHPESFQLEASGPNIYVNLPDLKQIAVINRDTHAIARWPLTLEHNFPMALDEADHRLFMGMHEPACLAVFDTVSGRMIVSMPSVQDADDLYYDAARKRIYMPGGEGFIYAFQQTDPDHYRLLAKIPTALGARTAGYFGKGNEGFRPILSRCSSPRRSRLRDLDLYGAELEAARFREAENCDWHCSGFAFQEMLRCNKCSYESLETFSFAVWRGAGRRRLLRNAAAESMA